MIKIIAEINTTENRKTIEKLNEIKSWFFVKLNNKDENG